MKWRNALELGTIRGTILLSAVFLTRYTVCQLSGSGNDAYLQIGLLFSIVAGVLVQNRRLCQLAYARLEIDKAMLDIFTAAQGVNQSLLKAALDLDQRQEAPEQHGDAR